MEQLAFGLIDVTESSSSTGSRQNHMSLGIQP
jgi:hypothetical protein